MLLHPAYQALNSSQYTNNGFIRVTSPEQFVPLFLAGYLPGPILPSSLGHTQTMQWATNKCQVTVSRERYDRICDGVLLDGLADGLKERLDVPMLTGYRVIPRAVRSRSITAPGFRATFTGTNSETAPMLCDREGICVGLGFIAETRTVSVNILNSSRYGHPDPQKYNLTGTTREMVITVIRAKHLNYARACIHLQVPLELPYSDLKILSSWVINNGYIRDLMSTVNAYASNLGLNIEYVDNDVLNSYIHTKGKHKTEEQALSDAKLVVEDPMADCFLI